MTYHYNPDRISLEEIPLKKKHSWKKPFIVGIIVALAIVFVFSTGSISKMKSISGAFLSSIGVPESHEVNNEFVLNKRIDFTSNFNYTGPLKFKFPVFKLTVNFNSENSRWNIGNEILKFSENGSTEIELYGFDGEIIAGDVGYINGTCDKIFVNGIELYPDESNLKISTTGLNYNTIEMKDVEMPGFENSNLVGDINVGNNTKIDIDGNDVKIGKFKGDINIDRNSIVLNGATENIEVLSEYNIVIS